MIVEEVMTEGTVTVSVDPTASPRDALERMFEAGVRHLPVIDDEELVGILSDRDLRGLWQPPTTPKLESATESVIEAVGELMSSDVISVTPETDLGEVVDIMLENRIGAVPVVREGTRELVGLVSYIDVLRAARESF